jgi:type IV pilus assembly protein PilQ
VPAPAAAEAPPAAPAAAGPTIVVTPAGDRSSATGGIAQTVSLTLDDVPLADVVKLFTRVSGANIIAATSNLQGQVTANLQEVPWRPAFESILERQGLLLLEKPPASGIFVIEERKAGEEPRLMETIALNYAKVDDVVKLIQSVLGKEGTITPFPAGNAVIIHASALRTAELRKIVEGVDKPRAQVYIEAKFVQLSRDVAKNIGINWQSLSGFKISTRTAAEISGARERLGPDNTRGFAVQRTYDQFGNEVPILDHYETVTLPSGTVSMPVYRPTTTSFENRNTQVSSLRSLSAVLSPDEFAVVLSALESDNGTKLISNPKIIVANEQLASIKVAQDEPNVKLTRSRATVQGQEDLITSELDSTKPFFTYGITVEVTPRINTTSNITVIIKPELSRKVDTKIAPDGNEFPIVEKKNVDTTFNLSDGRTAAIGGLIETKESDVESRIPLLGSIPWIGPRLFGHTSKQKTQTEIIIFVTVGIVQPDQVTKETGLPDNATLVRKPGADR